jgi:hypothetical protein
VSEVPHSEDAHHASHGNTPAAWSAVVMGLLGFVVGGVGLMFNPANFVIFWVGVAITLIAGVLYLVMQKLGFGS